VNTRKQLEGKYEKVDAGRYSSVLIKLMMERMMSVVWKDGWIDE
jgi:hypothetical protein